MVEKEKKVESEQNLFADEECKRAAEKAMSLLLYQDRTRKELLERLYRASFSEAASLAALEYVESFGYINDKRYVENFIMFQKDRRSRREMIYKLSAKGISKELVQEVLEEIEYEGETVAVQTLLQKKLKGRAIDELTYEEKNKLFASIGRKGYELHTIKKVFSKLDN